MPAMMLGKRTRSSAGLDEPLVSLPTHTKRRTRTSPKMSKEQQSFAIHQDTGFEADLGLYAISPCQKAATPFALSPSKGNMSPKQCSSNSKQADSVSQFSKSQSPRTPRHRDALSKKQSVTPRHRVSMAGVPFTPRTPNTPTSASRRVNNTTSVFADGRRLFSRSSQSGGLVGRQREREELDMFIDQRIQRTAGGCIYVSGPPGTGKSAFVTEICDARKQATGTKYAYLNCMSVKSATDVYTHLISELGVSDDVFGSHAKDNLSKAVLANTNSCCYLVVLDEIDQLLELDMRTLYSLFEWALSPLSRLVLIGIANALDLTDRFLPQLKARNLKPQLLPFLPYSAPDIASVLSNRARSLLGDNSTASPDFTPFFTHQAIQLVSKKVAAQSGDLRKAFDISQKLIDLLEAEAREQLFATQHVESPVRKPLGENANLSSPHSPGQSEKNGICAAPAPLTFETAPRASLGHVLRVTNAAFAANSTTSRLKTLNLQQKAALCSMAALEARNQKRLQFQKQQCEHSSLPSPADTPSAKRVKTAAVTLPRPANVQLAAPTVREVYDAYGALCRTESGLHALSSSEFRDVISNLETAGLVSGVDGRGSFVQVAPTTPSRKGRGGAGPALSVRVEDCRIKGSASAGELESVLDGPGCEVLRRMLRGDGF